MFVRTLTDMRKPLNLPLHVTALWISAALLAGCGAEVAGTAAHVGALQVEQARQAQERQARILEDMKKAQQAGVDRAASAAAAAGG